MHLPNEIILQALRDVPKIDLKAIRLVNKQWSSCAADFLFDTVYISPHKPNIDVFQRITRHPDLRGCVAKLAFDAVNFRVKWSFSQYISRLRHQVQGIPPWLKETLDISDIQIINYIESTNGPNSVLSEDEYKDFDFIKAGYRKWQEYALYEQRCLDDNSFMRTFVTGLQRLNRLNTVRMDDAWPWIGHPEGKVAGLAHRTTGSPLARSWEFLDAEPLAWCESQHTDRGVAPFPGSREFWTILVALSKSEKQIRSFELSRYIAVATFDNPSIATGTRLLHGVDAFARLKELRLKISLEYDEVGEQAVHGKLNGLRILLDCIRDIEVLELCLRGPGIFGSAEEQWVYGSIFPRDGVWPYLRDFTIDDLEIQGRELIHLLFVGMPSLQYLALHDIRLPDHTWNAVIKALKFRRLSSFEIYTSPEPGYMYETTCLWPVGPVGDYLIWIKGLDRSFFAGFERYVVCGVHDWTLRHPSLQDSQPTQDSLDYLGGIFDGVNGSKSIVDIDVPKLKRHVAQVCAEADAERQMAEIAKASRGETSEIIAEKATENQEALEEVQHQPVVGDLGLIPSSGAWVYKS